MANVGNFECCIHFELGPSISDDVDIRHLNVSQRLTRPCYSKASPERYLCVDCSLVRKEN
jgi:hypothetical protein